MVADFQTEIAKEKCMSEIGRFGEIAMYIGRSATKWHVGNWAEFLLLMIKWQEKQNLLGTYIITIMQKLQQNNLLWCQFIQVGGILHPFGRFLLDNWPRTSWKLWQTVTFSPVYKPRSWPWFKWPPPLCIPCWVFYPSRPVWPGSRCTRPPRCRPPATPTHNRHSKKRWNAKIFCTDLSENFTFFRKFKMCRELKSKATEEKASFFFHFGHWLYLIYKYFLKTLQMLSCLSTSI